MHIYPFNPEFTIVIFIRNSRLVMDEDDWMRFKN